MKKIIIIGLVAVVIIILAAVVGTAFFLDAGIKKGVETVGPRLTKVNVKLDSVAMSLLSGSGKMKGLEVGNPEGYKTPSAIKVGTARMAVKPSTLLADKVVIDVINVEAPEITFETDLRNNNLSKIMANLDETMGGGKEAQVQAEDPKAARKLQVNEFVVTGGKVHVALTAMGGKSVTVPLPEIRLKDLGTGPEGITAAALTKEVLKTILNTSVEAGAKAATEFAKGAAADIANQAQKAVGEGAGKAISEGLGGLLKKKK